MIAVPDLLASVPPWLSQGWTIPITMAGMAAIVGLAFMYLSGLFTVAATLVGRTSGEPMPWGFLARQPAYVWLSFHGGVTGSPMTITGLAWIVVSFAVANSLLRKNLPAAWQAATTAPSRVIRLALVVKTAIAYTVCAVVASVAVNALRNRNPNDLSVSVLAPSDFGPTNLAATIFMSLIISAPIALWIHAHNTRVPVSDLLGIPVKVRFPRRFSSMWSGGRRIIVIATVGMMIFFYFATILDIAGSPQGPSGKLLFADAIAYIPAIIIWTGFDVGLQAFILSMRFFLGEKNFLPTGTPGWVYASLIIAVVAFLAGGMLAARKSDHKDGLGVIKTAAATGPVVAMICFAYALFRVSQNGSGGLIATGLLLPLLWAAVAAAGGFIYANQHGLPVRVTVTYSGSHGPGGTSPPSTTPPASAPWSQPSYVPTPPPPAQAATVEGPASPRSIRCPSCSSVTDATGAFCDSCGARIGR